jgi:demethoxyubiquinone hydroxylase (CLK1/Coq7/Cat5 family)
MDPVLRQKLTAHLKIHMDKLDSLETVIKLQLAVLKDEEQTLNDAIEAMATAAIPSNSINEPIYAGQLESVEEFFGME